MSCPHTTARPMANTHRHAHTRAHEYACTVDMTGRVEQRHGVLSVTTKPPSTSLLGTDLLHQCLDLSRPHISLAFTPPSSPWPHPHNHPLTLTPNPPSPPHQPSPSLYYPITLTPILHPHPTLTPILHPHPHHSTLTSRAHETALPPISIRRLPEPGAREE